MTHGFYEGIGHAAADDNGVGLFKQVIDNADLVRDLGAAEDSHEGTCGIIQSLAHDGQFLFDQQACVCGQVCRDSGGGGVGAVDGAECVGNINLSQIAQGFCEVGAVFLLADIEAEVFKKHDLTGLQSCGLGLRVLADDVLCEDDLLTEELGKALCHGCKRQLFLPLALGLAKMRAGDDGRSLIQQIFYSGERGNDSLIACDLAGLLVLRHVKVAAEQDLLPLYVCIEYAFLTVIHSSSPFRRKNFGFILKNNVLTVIIPPWSLFQ